MEYVKRHGLHFSLTLLPVTLTFALLSAAYFEVAKGNAALAGKVSSEFFFFSLKLRSVGAELLISGGATAFICGMCCSLAPERS